MIQYLKRNEIDIAKYDFCIENAINSRIYAYSWYLDIVADNWDALILNDYEAVMPLPWRQKYFIKYIYPPAWTQQLGVFSSKKLNAELVKQFINSIPRKFKKVTVQFNSGNDLSLFKTEKRVNYILDLNRSYDDIYKGFKKDRKKSLKKSIENQLTFNNDYDVVSLFQLYNISFPNLNFDKKNFPLLKLLIKFCINKNYGFQRNVYMKNKVIARAFFLEYDKRVYYLFGASTLEGKKVGATTFLINSVLEDYSSTDKIFDFEGSMMKGVKDFYKSFGAKTETYFKIEYNNLPTIFKLFKS